MFSLNVLSDKKMYVLSEKSAGECDASLCFENRVQFLDLPQPETFGKVNVVSLYQFVMSVQHMLFLHPPRSYVLDEPVRLSVFSKTPKAY